MSDDSSDGSTPKPKKKPKRVVLSSSGTDSESGAPVVRKRRRLWVISDNELDSSGSEIIRRRRRAVRQLCQSDSETASSESDSDHSTPDTAKEQPSTSKQSGFSSDSSEGNSEKCSICLIRFKGQEVGTPENCQHIFCLDCITEWSMNVNTCPVDRSSFNSIIVRDSVGGEVLRTVPVKVTERRPSVEMFVIEDPTFCEVCRSSDSEETMLLCDGCDLGFHMQCLTPPMQQIPVDEWFCSECAQRDPDEEDFIYLSEVDGLLSDIQDIQRPMGPRPSRLREPRQVRRSVRGGPQNQNEPSTSSGGTSNQPSSSQNVILSRSTTSRAAPSRRTTTARRRKYKRRRTRTVVVEYEIENGEKFPIKKKKTVKRRVKKRRAPKRQPRTAARRAHVRASVRSQLQALIKNPVTNGSGATQAESLSYSRYRAGIPSLNLFGNSHELDYFSDEGTDEGGGGVAAVATALRPTSSILSAYRQARRKAISFPSPAHASSAPDILSSILESQTLLHSKKSLVSVTVDGTVNIKLETNKPKKEIESNNNSNTEKNINIPAVETDKNNKIDLNNVEDASKKVPAYPGQNRGGNWGGGYRGNYRDQGNNFRGGNNYGNNNYNNRGSFGGGYQSRPNFQGNNNWQEDQPGFQHDRRPSYSEPDNYRPNRPLNLNRGRGNFNTTQRLNFPLITESRLSFQSYDDNEPDHNPQRHSFGGFPSESYDNEPNNFSNNGDYPDNDALDMRTGTSEPMGPAPEAPQNDPMDLYGDIEGPKRDPTPPTPYEPLPEPPVFRFVPTEKSEDEKSDSSLIIDTEKYDPTEPTHDDDESVDEKPPIGPIENPLLPMQIPLPESPLRVTSTVLDKAVQQVLQEHRNLIMPNQKPMDKSDDDSDGDCPNFSIYSATSVNIANNSNNSIATPLERITEDYAEREEDLVQQDDDSPVHEPAPEVHHTFKPPGITESVPSRPLTAAAKKGTPMDFDEKVSKRCPITPTLRNPIKIKLNTPALIKRTALELYDPEEEEDEEDPTEEVKTTDSTKAETQTTSPSKIDTVPVIKDKEDESTKSQSPLYDETVKAKSRSSSVESKGDRKRGGTPLQEENNDSASERANDPISDEEIEGIKSPESKKGSDKGENIEKMTESISETEDERSYTPCLDENKSKDTSLENEKENVGLEGLDTEMISEDEGNELFSDIEGKDQQNSDRDGSPSPTKELTSLVDQEEGEIVEKKKELPDEIVEKPEETKKKKKKEKKAEKGKEKTKGKKKSDEITFKKLSKSGKERNYRDKDDKKNKIKKKSDDKENKERAQKARREKRKDLERYDVRNVVTEKRRKVKDVFGRDTSRPRSKSPSFGMSPTEVRKSPSVGRSPNSLPRMRKSLSRLGYTPSVGTEFSRGRKSVSPRMGRSLSPRAKSPSPRIRLISPEPSPIRHKRKSISPPIKSFRKGRRSISPRRRSMTPKRRLISPRRRSISPRRRSISPRRRSISPRRRSVSPKRFMSPRRKSPFKHRKSRSLSRGRKRRRSLSRSPRQRKSKSPKRKKRLPSRHRSVSKHRSRSPKPKKSRKTKARKSRSPRRKSPKQKIQKKRKSRSISPEFLLSPERSRERIQANMWRNDKSPMYHQGWNDSRSINSRLLSPSWTPPRELSPDPRHLRVILPNNEKARRKEKKKRQRDLDKHRFNRNKELGGPSKEVFTSGNNILVSVSFDKNDENAENLVGEDDFEGRKRKRKGDPKRKDKRKKKSLNRANKETENKKPVAIIDLDKSPFAEITPSPKNVIVLSDSDHGGKDDPIPRQVETREATEEPQQQQPQFNVGPKTPPEPSVKFSIMTKSNAQLRSVNPLHEEERDDDENQEAEVEKRKEGTHKGPNTPPEPPNSPPSSPDAYDPFEPTKSASASPDRAQNNEENDSQEKQTITLETAQKTNLSADDVVNQRPITPIEKVMALLQSTRNVSPTQITDGDRDKQESERPATPKSTHENQSPSNTNIGVVINKTVQPQSHFSSATVAPSVATSAPIYMNNIPRIGAFTTASNSTVQITSNQRIVLPSPTKASPMKSQPAKLFLAKPSPIKSTPIKPMPSKTIISKLPLPSVKPIPGRKNKNGNDDIIDLDMDMDSPYSPGSSDFGDLFEPPTDGNSRSYSKPTGKGDIFDSLFGSKPISRRSKSSPTKVPVKQIKKKAGNKTQVGVKLDEDSLKILDDLPSSAVEMQVKSKFLKKLNRQERVVEEVKLVLKPHYNKKHVTKDEYKDILRRAVPKICHNKTGEINPTKIQALVEAYVKKCRKKRKNVNATM